MKKKNPQQQDHLGVFCFDHINVDVFVYPHNTGGEFYFCPGDKSLPRIKIGLDYPSFEHVMVVLLHEAQEFAYCMFNHRYVVNGSHMPGAGDCYTFVFTHAQFTEATIAAGMFIGSVVDQLKSAYKKARR